MSGRRNGISFTENTFHFCSEIDMKHFQTNVYRMMIIIIIVIHLRFCFVDFCICKNTIEARPLVEYRLE